MKNKKNKNKEDKTSGPLVQRNIKEILDKLKLAEKERDEYLNGWKRARADLVNFKKETISTISELSEIVKMDFTKNFLPILDALDNSEEDSTEGVRAIRDLFLKSLNEMDVEEIKIKKGDKFNPEQHEAIEGEGELIEEIIQKGYKLSSPTGEKVIRPVKVVVRK